jgi:hypothetical protein
MATSNGNTSSASETFGTSSPVTGSAPSGATDGQSLKELTAVTVVVDTASGKTLSGGGFLECWTYDASTALWTRYPDYDITLFHTEAVRSLDCGTFSVPGGRASRIKWVPGGVTFSSGTAGVTVYQLGQSKKVIY